MGIYNLGGGGGDPVLEARTVTPSTSQQIIKPSRDEYDGLSQVTVEATPLETRTVNPSTSSQTITPSGSNIGFSTITVNPYRLQSKSVTPSTVPYTVSPDSGYNGLSGVTFGKDTNLVADNIASGKTIYGVTGNLYRCVLQEYATICTDNTTLKFTIQAPSWCGGFYRFEVAETSYPVGEFIGILNYGGDESEFITTNGNPINKKIECRGYYNHTFYCARGNLSYPNNGIGDFILQNYIFPDINTVTPQGFILHGHYKLSILFYGD